MMMSEIFEKKLWKETIRESGVLASQIQDVSPLRDLADALSWKHLWKSFAEDLKAKYIMEMSGSSHHPLRIKPIQKIYRRSLGSERETQTAPFPQPLSPHLPQPLSPLSFPLPAGRGFLFGDPRPALPVSSPGVRALPRGCGGRAGAVSLRGAAGAGPGQCGPALRGRRKAAGPGRRCGAARSRSTPPHLRGASPHRWGAAAGAAPPACGAERDRGRGGDGCCWRPYWGLCAAPRRPRRGAAAGGGRPAWARCCGRWRRLWRTRSTSCATRCRRWGGGGWVRGHPAGREAPFPLTSPGRAAPHLRAAPRGASLSPAFVGSCQRPPLRVPSAGPGRWVRQRKPAAGPARAPPVRSRSPRRRLARFSAGGARKSFQLGLHRRKPAVLPPSSGGAAGGVGSTGAAACWRCLLRFWRYFFPLAGFPAPLLASPAPPLRPSAAVRPCGSGLAACVSVFRRWGLRWKATFLQRCGQVARQKWRHIVRLDPKVRK